MMVLFATCFAIATISQLWRISISECPECSELAISEKESDSENQSTTEKAGYVFTDRFKHDLIFYKMEYNNGSDYAVIYIANKSDDIVDELRIKRLEIDGESANKTQIHNWTSENGQEYKITIHDIGLPWCFGAQWVNLSFYNDGIEVGGTLNLGERLFQKKEYMVIE